MIDQIIDALLRVLNCKGLANTEGRRGDVVIFANVVLLFFSAVLSVLFIINSRKADTTFSFRTNIKQNEN